VGTIRERHALAQLAERRRPAGRDLGRAGLVSRHEPLKENAMNARVPGLNAEQVLREVTQAWDSDIVRQLSDYIAIPAKSPAFDAQWQAHGHLETVVQRATDWVRAQKVEGLTLEIVRLPGRTPILWFEVPATRALAES
jgi:hypothetical protein